MPQHLSRALVGALLLLPLPAWAQSAPATAASDLEYRESELDRQKGKLEVRAGFETEWHEYDNLDLRPLDESSDQAILDSDDRDNFAFTGFFLDLGYKVDDKTRVVTSLSHRGLWGNDQIGNVNAYGGLFYFSALYVDFSPAGLGEGPVRFRVGREFFQIGGLGGARDYVLADVLDEARVTVKLGGAGRLELIPMTVVGSSSENDNANFVSFIGQSTTQTFGFRGAHMTKRSGGMVVLDGITKGLDVRAYGFYTKVGALGSGSDISYNGELGNFSDNDWVANFGLRGSYAIAGGKLTPFASLDLSRGVDRKELVTQDVNCDGMAVMGGLTFDTGGEDDGLHGEASYFNAQGAAYTDDGQQFSHGYVSMKAQQAGGTLTNRLMGWHPSAYVGMFGISDDVHDVDRKAGTQVIHANVGYTLPMGLDVTASYWTFKDTGITALDPADLERIDPPYGYSRAEFAAEERVGKALGQEINLDVGYALTKHIDVFANGAVFLPGDFYATDIARIAGDQLGGQATAWGANGGTRVRF